MKKITFLFALLCASVMGFAIDWSGVDWLANSNEKYKLLITPNFGDQYGGKRQEGTNLWIGFPSAAFGDMSIEQSGGAGAWKTFALSNFPNQENQFTVVCGGTTYTFDVYFVDGSTKSNPALTLNSTAETLDATAPAETFQIVPSQSGDGAVSYESSNPGIASVDNTGLVTAVGRGKATITVSTAETATYAAASKTLTVTVTGPINWDGIGWLSGSNNKYKLSISPEISDTYGGKHVQNGTDLWIGFPSAAFGDMSIEQSGGAGAWKTFALSNFPNQENQFTVVCDGKTYTFDVFYADGTSGGTPTKIYDVNFALASNGSSATASSGTAANAIDGNEGTRWESAATDDETWTLDMGQLRIFNTIKILWEGAYCKEFELTYSTDGDTWSPLYTETNLTQAGWQLIELSDEVTAQYIKYHGTKRATGWGQSFWEFQVLLPGVSVLTSIDLSAAGATTALGGAGIVMTATPKDQNGQAMEAAVSYEITPAAAGHMDGNTFIPDQVGNASIRAYNGEVYSPVVTIVAYTGSNVALEKDVEASGYDDVNNLFPSFAVDNNEGSLWSARVGETGAEREYDAWIVVDLGAFYDINLIALRWEGACSRHYHVDFSADKSTWRTAYNAGWDAIATHWEYLIGTAEDNTKVRYVRVWSTEAVSQYGVKIMDLKVFGVDWVPSGDTEAPVMTSASLVSSTSTSAIIAVEATDADGEVARYHVVDATNGIDANYIPEAGNITITGLTHATNYNFTITAIDAATHESENSINVPVSTPFDVTINLALNKTCEAGYEDGNPTEVAAKVNDGNENSSWVTYADRPASEEWWYVDLGDVYTLSNITVVWGGDYSTNYILQTRVEAPATADKANDAAWITIATVTDAAANSTKSTDLSGIGRYVRFRSVTRSGVCIRLKELRVFGTGKVAADTEKPVMTSASLVSNTDSHAVIAVAATDNQGIANYHVVDAGNSFDANFAAVAGNITVTGLTGGTAYTLVITAVDYFGNESANSKSVEVATTAHYTQPQAACPAPTWDASLVKAMYSPTYSADYTHQDWGSGTVYTQEEYGKKYVTNGNGYFGADGFELNCLLMEKLHYDIWIADDATVRIVPIWGGAEQGITVNLTGQQWNSVDIELTEYTGVTNWGNIYQMKIDNAKNLTFWVANAYFYREAAYVDDVAPTNVSASKVAEGFYSVKISAQAEDNSGAVSFKVMNGEEVLATGAAASGVATTIMVNNLTPGTNYNFNVVAYDEANNEADPVAVAAATKALPAPAPAPNLNGKNVVNVFSDAIEGSKTIHSGGWGETTQVEWLDIAEGDKVFYAQNFNYAGWHSWGADIDATNMVFLHVDVYSTGMTSVSVTPISHDPTNEGSAAIALTPNAWTSADIALSAYPTVEWNKIFQFKFMGAVGGNEFMVDNVYFWQPKVTALAEQGGDPETGGWATFSSAAKVAVPSGMKAYKAAYDNSGDEEVLTLTEVSVIPAGAGVILRGAAGEEYAFTLSTADDPDMDDNSLVGCPVRTDVSADRETKDIFCMRYSASYDFTGFFLYEGQYVPAGKAYLALPKLSLPSSAPRHVRFAFNEEQVATGVENTNANAVEATKFIENGQLYIRRGEAVYNLQGVRVK